MSFAQPLFLLGLVGALVPIIIHLIHRRRPRKQPFAAIELVIQSVQRVERRWRLRRFLLLAARVLLIAALAVAASRPLWGSDANAVREATGPERIAIVVDSTLSMRATYDGTSAFNRAKTEARNLIDRLGPEDMAVLVRASDTAELLVPRPTADHALLLDRLNDMRPSFTPGDMGVAVSTAVQALGVAEGGDADRQAIEQDPQAPPAFGARVVVLSDLAQSSFQNPADLVVPGTNQQAILEVFDVVQEVAGQRRPNKAIAAVGALHVPDRAPRTVEVRARIQSFDSEPDDPGPVPVDITLRESDRELALGVVEVVGGTIVDKVIRHSFESAGLHSVAVGIESDLLTEDDVRYANVVVRRQVRVLVIDGAPSGVPKEDEVFYLERALLAGAADQPPPRIMGADDLARADLSAFDVVILAGVDVFNRPEGSRLTQFVEGGGGLLITMSETLDADLYNSELARVLPRQLRGLKRAAADTAGGSGPQGMSPPDLADPITRIFTGEALGGLLSTQTSGYFLMEPATEPSMAVHLRFDDGQPALVTRTVGSGRVGVLATSIDRDLTDLPIRPAFVPLVRQTVLYLGRALEIPDNRKTLVGQPRRIKVPSGVQQIRVVAPDGRETAWSGRQVAAGEVTYEQTRLPGRYSVSVAYASAFEPLPGEDFVVNIDPRESDLKPLSKDEARALLLGEATADTSSNTRLSASIGRSLDPEALAAALLALMAFAFIAESALSAVR